jgi:6-phospho-beta-glucosidase
VRIVVLGGSAHSTPALFRCLAAQVHVPRLEFCLVGRSLARLEGVLRAARLLTEWLPISIQAAGFSPPELAAALRGADVVLVQVRVGGYEARHFDESFPLQWGICGDEGLGPGGLSAAWRSWPSISRILRMVADVCPGALVLMLSSPVGILVSAARRQFPALRTYGICELPWTTLLDLSALLNAPAGRIDFDYLGVNHIGWFYHLEFDGRDLLLEYAAQDFSATRWPPSALVASCAGFPTKYLRIHYNHEQVLEEQLHQVMSRAETLRQIGIKAELVFREGGTKQILAALGRRPTPWYDSAVTPFILSLSGVPTPITFFLTGPNGLTEPALDPSESLEIPTRVSAGRLCPRFPRVQPSIQILDTVRAFLTYEQKAVRAVTERDAQQMRDALEIHPWVNEPELASALVRKITAQCHAGSN